MLECDVFSTYNIFVLRRAWNPLMFVFHDKMVHRFAEQYEAAVVCLVFLHVEHVTFYFTYARTTHIAALSPQRMNTIISNSYRRFSYSLYGCIINMVGKTHETIRNGYS